jgi:hypothetical protein
MGKGCFIAGLVREGIEFYKLAGVSYEKTFTKEKWTELANMLLTCNMLDDAIPAYLAVGDKGIAETIRKLADLAAGDKDIDETISKGEYGTLKAEPENFHFNPDETKAKSERNSEKKLSKSIPVNDVKLAFRAAHDIKPDKAEEHECPLCGAKIGEDCKTCPECGEKFE